MDAENTRQSSEGLNMDQKKNEPYIRQRRERLGKLVGKEAKVTLCHKG